MRTHSRRAFAVLAGAVLVGGTLSSIATAPPAQAVVTKQLVTATSVTGLANSVRAISHPSTVSNGVVALATDAVSIAQAAGLAARTGATVISSDSGTSATALNTIVTQKSITSLTLVGATGAFTSAFISAISSQVTTKTSVLNNSAFTRSTLLAATAQPTSFVIGRASVVGSLNIALAYASATGASLIVVDGSETESSLTSYFGAKTDPKIAVAGGESAIPYRVFTAQDSDKFEELSTATPGATFAAIGQMSLGQNRAANRIVSAPLNDLAGFALATLVAKAQGSIAVAAGNKASLATGSAAEEYLALWKNETSKVVLVGVSTTSAELDVVAQRASDSRTSTPAWTVTNTTLGSGNHTITMTGRTGATTYKAVDSAGAILATSATPTLTLAGPPQFTTLVAYNSTGVELERMEFRSNVYEVASDRESAVVGTIRGGVANIRLLGTSTIPRKIVRYSVDPYWVGGDTGDAVVIAETCATTFTETGLDPQKQWVYEVSNLTSKTGSGCGQAAGAPLSGSALLTGAVNLPLTQVPPLGVQARMATAHPSSVQPRAGQTVADAMAEAGTDAASAVSGEMSTNAISGSGWAFFYLGYIPGKYIQVPGFTGDIFKPAVMYNASDREWYDLWSTGDKFSIKAYVYSSSVTIDTVVGHTIKYKCSVGPECIQIDQGQAAQNTISGTWSAPGSTTNVNYHVDSGNPLEPVAGPINGDLSLKLTPSSWTLRGTHDKMPVHQFWYGYQNSDAYLAYTSKELWSPVCLYGALGGPWCVADVNVRL